LKVIPVIDILNGVVVHAVKGLRNQYHPIQSTITKSTTPVEVAQAFKALGFNELYVADLDAIVDCSSDFTPVKHIVDETALSLMVDAGITSQSRATLLLKTGVYKIVIGTETLTSKTFIAQALEQFGSDRVVVSLDLKGDKVLTKPQFGECTNPLCLFKEFKAIGVKQVIVLDLTRVGSGEGVNIALLKEAIDLGFEVYVGGGVRDIYDLVKLKASGVKGALVATALHTGKVSIENLKREGFL
jgi:phosphoribosylformimino-5-aminoimidazole carboxamide ribotide isomerase